MTLKLNNFPHPSYEQKVGLTLREKGFDFANCPVDSIGREPLSGWCLKFNPDSVVPSLAHDDGVIIDCSIQDGASYDAETNPVPIVDELLTEGAEST